MVKLFCKSLAIFVVLASTFWCRAQANDPVVARYHFVGTSQLTAKNYDDVRKILNQPSSVEYRNLVLNRFAGQIAASISPSKGKAPATSRVRFSMICFPMNRPAFSACPALLLRNS